MDSSIFLENNEIVLLLHSHEDIAVPEYRYTLGTGFLDFLSFPKSEVEWVFNWLGELFLHINEMPKEEYKQQLKPMLQSVIQYCPNLYFYCAVYIEFCNNFKNDPKQSISDLLYFADDVDKVLERNEDTRLTLIINEIAYYCENEQSIDKNFFVIRQDAGILLIEDILMKKEKYQHDISKILSLKTNDNRSLEECLYNFEIEKDQFEYYGYPKHIDYMPYPRPAVIKGKHNYYKSKLLPMHRLAKASDLLYLELISIVQADLTIKTCKFCKRYFTPLKRKDAKYCENVDNEIGKPCNMVAPRVLYNRKKAEDPITQSYSKAYNRMRSRYRNGKLSQKELYNWQTEAVQMRDSCKSGEISLNELAEWLDGF